MRVSYLNLIIPAIHACSKRATSAFAFAYACKLLAKSSTQCRLLPVLVYPICDWRCCRNGKGLAYKTNLSSHKSESQVVKISRLKSMSETVLKMLKQQSTQRKCRRKSSRRTAFQLLLCKLLEDFRHSCKLIHKVQALLTVTDLYQQKMISL